MLFCAPASACAHPANEEDRFAQEEAARQRRWRLPPQFAHRHPLVDVQRSVKNLEHQNVVLRLVADDLVRVAVRQLDVLPNTHARVGVKRAQKYSPSPKEKRAVIWPDVLTLIKRVSLM